MGGIDRKTFDRPDETFELQHGRMYEVRIGHDEPVWLSEYQPGWNWDEDFARYAGGATSCPLTHREYVVAGTIRYVMDDGSETTASAGDVLFIRPGHRAWVVGEEKCVLLDW
ncbi:MAG: cupin [Chloroflexota bacterium]|nr:cupin [Chloroflexota bacterium]